MSVCLGLLLGLAALAEPATFIEGLVADEAGFDGAAGFEPSDAVIYVEALRKLLSKE